MSPPLGLGAASSFEFSEVNPRDFPRQGMTLPEQIEVEGRKVLHAVVQMRTLASPRDAGSEPPADASAALMAGATPFPAVTCPEDQPESSATAAARARAAAAAEQAALLAAQGSWDSSELSIASTGHVHERASEGAEQDMYQLGHTSAGSEGPSNR